VQALFDSWTSLGRGLQRWHQAYFDHLQQGLQSIVRKREALVRSNSPVAFAEVQRDLYIELVSTTLRASTTLLQLTGQIAQMRCDRCKNGRAHAPDMEVSRKAQALPASHPGLAALGTQVDGTT
jgi:hypothetical protein